MSEHTASVVRLASEAPRAGSDYAFDYGGQQFCGTVVAITPMRGLARTCMWWSRYRTPNPRG